MSTTNPPQGEQSPIPADDKKPADVKPTDKPVDESVEDRIARLVAEGITAEKVRLEAERQAEKEEADNAKAKEQGEWKAVAEKAEKKAAEAEHLLAVQRRDTMLTDFLAAEHPDYLPRKRYIAPLIAADVKGDELTKAVKAAVADFVRDNPIEKKATNGPPQPQKPGRVDPDTYPKLNGHDTPRPRFTALNFNG